MIDQFGGGEGEGVELAERMALQELEVSLFAPLPLRDALEGLDVPANELGERWRTMIDASECVGMFKRHLAMLCPARCCSTQRESLVFAVDDGLAASNANNRGISRRSIGLPSRSDRRNAEFLEESRYS